MRELFVPKTFGAEAVSMISTINSILKKYQQQGYDLSLRQLYYQLVAGAVIENTERSYKNIGNLVSDARLAGMIDWDMIKDRGREMIKPPAWDSPSDIIDACANQFRVSRWENQDCYVEVMVEKQALEGVLMPVCDELDVPFTANKGYSSSSAMYEASKRFIRAIENGKKPHILYLGDHDPSGIDMTRDVCSRIDLFVKTSMEREEIRENELDAVPIKRLALNMDQVKKLNPPENPAKVTDSRAKGYISKFGHSSWELDAIEPAALAKLVRDAVMGLVEPAAWAESAARIKDGRNVIAKMAEDYRKNNGSK